MIYAAGRTQDSGSESDDLLMVIVPGPPPNVPTSKNLQLIHNKMKSIKPRLQSPKIGEIESACADVLRRSKQHAAFAGSDEGCHAQIADDAFEGRRYILQLLARSINSIASADYGDTGSS